MSYNNVLIYENNALCHFSVLIFQSDKESLYCRYL